MDLALLLALLEADGDETSTFPPALELLVDALPTWWATDLPTSEISILLQAFGELADELAVAFEQIYLDQTLETASGSALQSQWAVIYGVSNEQLPPTVDALRGYLQARAADDGSTIALENTLLALLSNPANGTLSTGALTFAIDGSGLTLPADGSGLAFPAAPDLTIIEHLADHLLEVDVKTTLIFDRGAFDRAVNRARPADALYEIVEV